MMAKQSELVDIEGELVSPYETNFAYRFYDGRTTVWIPKSQCEWDEHEKTMTMPRWLADEKGLV